MGWILNVTLSLNLIIWFSNVKTSLNPLTLLGIAETSADIALPVLSILFLSSPLGFQIRDRTGVSLSIPKLLRSVGLNSDKRSPVADTDTANNCVNEVRNNETTSLINNAGSGDANDKKKEGGPGGSNDNTTMHLFIEGLKIMFMDVAIQGCTTFTLYAALLQDSAVAYQISALQSALPQYGYGYAFGISMMFKLAGPQMLAKGQNKLFVTFAMICVGSIIMMVPGIVAQVVLARHKIALEFGSNACAYANKSQCVPFFTEIFGKNGSGGDFTLQYTFTALAFGSTVDCINLVLRSILLALLDFDFLVKSTIAAVLVYIPGMYVATSLDTIYRGQAITYYVAMNIPQLFLIFVFLFRLHRNFKRVLNGEKGTWTGPGEKTKSTLDTDKHKSNENDHNSATTAYKSELTPLLLSRRRSSNSSGGAAM